MVMTREEFNNYTGKSLKEEIYQPVKIMITETQFLMLKKS